MKQKFSAYLRLMRLDKPIGTLLLLWPTFWALWVAGLGRPSLPNLLVFGVGALLMRSAGCIMNDWFDRDVDSQVKRTRERPLATGEVSSKEAWLLVALLSLTAFALVLTRNWLTVELSFAGLFLAASYPLTKRFFPIPQAYLGIAFGFGIPMAFAAELHRLPLIPVGLLMVANILWAIAYDTEYAMVDRDDDIHLGIHSSALFFGRFDVLAIMLCYAGTLLLLALLGALLGYGMFYGMGLLAAALVAGYHSTLIRTRTREGCFRAFRHNNWFGAVIFAGLVLEMWLGGSGA
jgi:4-hydroxybenzoate polyprenyltransferase